MNNKGLYNKIMYNISKKIKYILSEDLQNFNPSDYTDDDGLSSEEISNILETPKTKEQLQKRIVIETEKNETRPNLSEIDTSLITDMSGLFNVNKFPIFTKIKYLDLSTWDTSNVTNMTSMFSNMNLNELKLTNWDTSNVIDMSYMFNGSHIKTLDVSMFDVSSVESMYGIFADSKFINLDLSNWEIDEKCYVDSMFRGFTKNQKVKVSISILVALVKNDKQFIEFPNEIIKQTSKPKTNKKAEELKNEIINKRLNKFLDQTQLIIYDKYLKGTIINNCIVSNYQFDYDYCHKTQINRYYPTYIKFIKNPLTSKILSNIKKRNDIEHAGKTNGINIYIENTAYSSTGDILSKDVIYAFMNQNKNTGTYGIFIRGRRDDDFTLIILDTDNDKIIAGQKKFMTKIGITDNLTIDKNILKNYIPDYIAISVDEI